MKKTLAALPGLIACMSVLTPVTASVSRPDHSDRHVAQTGATLNRSVVAPARQIGLQKLRPRIRQTSLTRAIPTISLNAINSFLTDGRILNDNILTQAPYILAGKIDRLLFGSGDIVYARGPWPAETTKIFGVFRPGKVFRDPESEQVLGYEAIKVASARVRQRTDDLYTLTLSDVVQTVRVGDRLLPAEQQQLDSMFVPRPPTNPVHGVIMSIFGGVSQVGKNDVVAINRGMQNGLVAGNILSIYKTGKTRRDHINAGEVQLPDEHVGLLMVFRSLDKMAYGLVLDTAEPIKVGDLVQNP